GEPPIGVSPRTGRSGEPRKTMREPHQPLRTFVVEPNEPLRRRIAGVLVEGGFRVAGEAGSLAVARALTARTVFDGLLVEIGLPDGDGVELIRELAEGRPEVCSVALSVSRDEEDLVDALLSGAAGYLTKDMPVSRLATTIAAAARGEAPLSRSMTSVL